MRQSTIINRILQQQNADESLWDFLNRLPTSDFNSLMLRVLESRVQQLSPPEVLQAYQRNKMFQPPDLPSSSYQDMDLLLLKYLPDEFELIDLAPVAPLGSCSVFGAVHQDKVLSALRGAEVLADNTNLLAFESAVRRRKLWQHDPKTKTTVDLANIHRLLRTQPLKDPKHTPHFRITSLTSAGRDMGNYEFEIAQLAKHINFYCRFLQEGLGLQHLKGNITLSPDLPSQWQKELLERVQQRIPLNFEENPHREAINNYYQTACFQINVLQADQEINIIDGGFTDWTQKLLNNRKERFIISAMGTELLIRLAGL